MRLLQLGARHRWWSAWPCEPTNRRDATQPRTKRAARRNPQTTAPGAGCTRPGSSPSIVTAAAWQRRWRAGGPATPTPCKRRFGRCCVAWTLHWALTTCTRRPSCMAISRWAEGSRQRRQCSAVAVAVAVAVQAAQQSGGGQRAHSTRRAGLRRGLRAAMPVRPWHRSWLCLPCLNPHRSLPLSPSPSCCPAACQRAASGCAG